MAEFPSTDEQWAKLTRIIFPTPRVATYERDTPLSTLEAREVHRFGLDKPERRAFDQDTPYRILLGVSAGLIIIAAIAAISLLLAGGTH